MRRSVAGELFAARIACVRCRTLLSRASKQDWPSPIALPAIIFRASIRVPHAYSYMPMRRRERTYQTRTLYGLCLCVYTCLYVYSCCVYVCTCRTQLMLDAAARGIRSSRRARPIERKSRDQRESATAHQSGRRYYRRSRLCR